VEPVHRLQPLELPARGAVVAERARVLTSRLPAHVARRELETLARLTGWSRESLEQVEVPRPRGPGNAVVVDVQSEGLCEVFTAFGARGVPAEQVAETVVAAARRYVGADVAVGEHLADQLLLPLALAGGGRFTTLAPTPHATTNAAVIQRFLDVPITFEELGEDRWLVVVAG
jgi:RNA 3'-terminal phosphate cyclase (ATP)